MEGTACMVLLAIACTIPVFADLGVTVAVVIVSIIFGSLWAVERIPWIGWALDAALRALARRLPVSKPPPPRLVAPLRRMRPSMTLVLDLDETLVHAVKEKVDCDFQFGVFAEDKEMVFYATMRPGIHDFIASLHPHFEIVIFTAARQEYADMLINHMGIHAFVDKRFFRDDCVKNANGHLVKPMQQVRDDLARVILVDDSPVAVSKNPENAVLIPPFRGDRTDTVLWDLVPFLLALRRLRDVRCVLGCRTKRLQPRAASAPL
mmetsp:Transcript_87428/g.234129  ORF Transcript_87428/g.234129 Transcript_87428/m.234129 type:complete len:263 (+) Transcript_87428:90-878(+)